MIGEAPAPVPGLSYCQLRKRNMWRVIAKHPAVDGSGNRYTVVEMGEGSKRDFVLQDGRALVPQQGAAFLVLETGEVVTLSDR